MLRTKHGSADDNVSHSYLYSTTFSFNKQTISAVTFQASSVKIDSFQILAIPHWMRNVKNVKFLCES
jgi:hypothetical protein